MIGIYCITNTLTNFVYIGQSKDIHRRWTTHIRDLRNNKHENRNLQNAFNECGENAFEFSVLEECTVDELLSKEIYYISRYTNKYNMCDGGGGLTNPTDDVRKRISSNLSGTNNGMYGIHLTGELNGMYGKHHSLATKEKISEKAKTRIGRNANRSRAVVASTGEVFYTMYDACSWCGLKDASSINKCCIGKTKTAGRHPKTNERLSWMYRDDLK